MPKSSQVRFAPKQLQHAILTHMRWGDWDRVSLVVREFSVTRVIRFRFSFRIILMMLLFWCLVFAFVVFVFVDFCCILYVVIIDVVICLSCVFIMFFVYMFLLL